MPDRRLADGEVVSTDGFTIEAIATPGHTANHMAYALSGADMLFAGDHVMAWSTSIVAPPDGAMSDYMASLEKLARRPETTYFPGHGGAVLGERRRVPLVAASTEGGHGGGDTRLRDLIFRKAAAPDHMKLPDSRAGAMSCLTGIAARKSTDEKRAIRIADLVRFS